ncbi:hypothetical protein GCM10010304_81240 [Streptomyces roseoviolaceus]
MSTDTTGTRALGEADRALGAVREALRGLGAIPDAAVRARAVGLVLREWAGGKTLPAVIRQQAVDTLHRGGMDFPEIGAAISTDRSPAWRIWKGK